MKWTDDTGSIGPIGPVVGGNGDDGDDGDGSLRRDSMDGLEAVASGVLAV